MFERPADLTAQGPMTTDDLVRALKGSETAAIMAAVVRELPALQSCTAYQTVAAVLAAHQAVPSLAALLSTAPSRGQGEGPERECPKCGWITTFAECCPDSPAPVASPEVPETDGSFGSMVPVRQVKLPVPAPAGPETGTEKPRTVADVFRNLPGFQMPDGPETGWLTMTAEQVDTARRWALVHSIPDDARAVIRRLLTEAFNLRSALSAATERAEKAEREAYGLKLAIGGGEDAPGSASLITVADAERFLREERGLSRDMEDRLSALESSRAAALKLAGEDADLISRLQTHQKRMPGCAWSPELAEAVAARLSSPSAPESGT